MIDLCKARLAHRSSYDKLESQCLYNLTPLAEHVYISLNKNHKKLCIGSETCLLDNLLGHLRTLLITFIISSNIWTITHTHTHTSSCWRVHMSYCNAHVGGEGGCHIVEIRNDVCASSLDQHPIYKVLGQKKAIHTNL